MDEFYAGKVKTILLYPGAQASWDEAEALIPPAKKGKKPNGPTQFRARVTHYANTGQLRSPEHMNSEGKGCFVIKAHCGLRAWGWLQDYEGRAVFIISHVVLKKAQKADPADLERCVNAKNVIEKKHIKDSKK